ncbi:MAG TPA: methyltransferase domain-containing protein [Chloroflexota bacterium]|nr:methyltransferase domain-containing protein [Chloroflexota bacterium]
MDTGRLVMYCGLVKTKGAAETVSEGTTSTAAGTGTSPTASPDHAEFVRRSMRQSWGARTRAYTEEAAPSTLEHARTLLEIVPPAPGERVLDVAAGPGVVALLAAERVGPGGSVIATDLAPEWQEIIAERCDAAGVSNVSFRAMGAEALDLPNDHFDVAYCQFGLMFVPDPVQAIREMHRVLRPGGRLGVVVWSTADKVQCFEAINKHLNPLLPPPPPGQELPTPLSLGERGLIERQVTEAGFGDVEATRRTLDFVADSPEGMWQLRVENGPPNVRQAVAQLPDAERERLKTTVMEELEGFRRDGKVRLPSEAIYVSARKGRVGE